MDKKIMQLMKIVKTIVNQGIKPYIVFTKFGIDWHKEAKSVGLKDRDFYYILSDNPNTVKPEKNAITIFDLRK